MTFELAQLSTPSTKMLAEQGGELAAEGTAFVLLALHSKWAMGALIDHHAKDVVLQKGNWFQDQNSINFAPAALQENLAGWQRRIPKVLQKARELSIPHAASTRPYEAPVRKAILHRNIREKLNVQFPGCRRNVENQTCNIKNSNAQGHFGQVEKCKRAF